MVKPVRTQTAVAVTRWRHLMPILSSIKTRTTSSIHSGNSHTGKQHGRVMAKTGPYLIMSVAPDNMLQPHALSRTDKVPCLPTSLPMLQPDALMGEVLGICSALGRPMTHLKDTMPPIDHPHPWHPRMRKRDPHARLPTNATFRWPMDPHPHQAEIFLVRPGTIYSQRPNLNIPTVCQLCLGKDHSAVTCKSRDCVCYKCNQRGHFARACVLQELPTGEFSINTLKWSWWGRCLSCLLPWIRRCRKLCNGTWRNWFIF